jgi:hypothetical protein
MPVEVDGQLINLCFRADKQGRPLFLAFMTIKLPSPSIEQAVLI